MWGLIVVLGLVAVVILVGVLIALGMRASRAGDDDDWMSDDEQPRGRRAGRSRGRRSRSDDPDDEPYGGDMRVAGGPMAGQAPHSQLPSAPMAGSGPAQLPAGSAPVPERPSEEMDDDEYWSTITFDKPKFPWRQDKDEPAAPRGQDPLGPAEPIEPVAPTRMQEAVPPAPALFPGHNAPQGPPVDSPAPPTTPQPAVMADPLTPSSIPSTLEVPSRHAGEAEPTTTTPAYGSAEQSGGFSYGGDTPSPYGDDPLNTGERPSYGSPPPVPPSTPTPSAGSPPLGTPTAGAPAGGTPKAGPVGDDPLKLPSVDELLAKIQSDRARSAAESAGTSGGFDPLKDPLDTRERPSYGSSSSSLGGWSPSDSLSSYGSSSSSDHGTSSSPSYGSSADSPYGSDPLGSGYSSASGYGSSSYDSGTYSSSSSSSGYSSDATSSYGSGSPLGDDPPGGGYTPSSSDYGSYGGSGDGSSGGYSSGGYPASGSSSYGSGYYGSSAANGYGTGSSGGPGADDADKTQAYPTSPYGSSYGSNSTEDKRSDDWRPYGDYRS